MVSSHAGLRYQLWIFRLRILHKNRQYRDTSTCLPTHTKQRFVKVAKVRIICTRSSSIVILLPTNTPTRIKKRSKTPNEPKMHDNDKTCFTFRTACLCPNSCATDDDRQMKMTASAQCGPHCCPSLQLVARFVLNAAMALHGRSTLSCPNHFSLCVIRFGTCSLWRLLGLDIRSGPLSSTCGLMMSARIASPCFPRPRFEVGLSSHVPQVSAKRVRKSCSIKSRTLRSSITMYSMLARPRLTSRYR